jgi:hypothetical protein
MSYSAMRLSRTVPGRSFGLTKHVLTNLIYMPKLKNGYRHMFEIHIHSHSASQYNVNTRLANANARSTNGLCAWYLAELIALASQ